MLAVPLRPKTESWVGLLASCTCEGSLGGSGRDRTGRVTGHAPHERQLVRPGLGVAVVPSWSARRELEADTLAAVRLGPAGLVRTWGVIYPERVQLPASVRALVALLVEVLPPLLGRAA